MEFAFATQRDSNGHAPGRRFAAVRSENESVTLRARPEPEIPGSTHMTFTTYTTFTVSGLVCSHLRFDGSRFGGRGVCRRRLACPCTDVAVIGFECVR